MALVYVASSAKNKYLGSVIDGLVDAGHVVLDWRQTLADDNKLFAPFVDSHGMVVDSGLKLIYQDDLVRDVYLATKTRLQEAKVCVLVLPAGRSACFEAGWATGQGKRVIVYWPGRMIPELMFKDCDIVGDLPKLLERLNVLHL